MLSRRKLLIYAEVNYPFVNKCFNFRTFRPRPDCRFPGFFIEFFGIIVDRLNISVQFLKRDDLGLNEKPGSNFTQSELFFDLLHNKTFDLFANFHDVSRIFNREYELSIPVYYSNVKYIVAPVETELAGIFDLFIVYDTSVWISAFSIFILFLIVGLLVYRTMINAGHKERTSFTAFAWHFLRLQLFQSDPIQHKSITGNFLILVFAFLHCGLVIQIYSNVIKTQAIGNVDPKPFKGHELVRVLKERQYSFLVKNGFHWWYHEIMTSNESPYFEVREAIKDNPIRLFEEFTTNENPNKFIIEKVLNGNGWITIGSDESIEIFRHMGYCDMIHIDSGFALNPKAVLMRKGDTFVPKMNKIILEETIHIRRLHNKYFKYGRSMRCEQTKRGPKALHITPYYSVMALFSGGIVLSLLVFFVEMFLKCVRKT